jgi:hypothetical protein
MFHQQDKKPQLKLHKKHTQNSQQSVHYMEWNAQSIGVAVHLLLFPFNSLAPSWI